MTNERDKHEMDERVSETYRALADEQTPEHLNASVLRMAADRRPAASGRNFFAGWMKPAAWAATVGLSLAIVLEVTQVSDLPVAETQAEKSSVPVPATEIEMRSEPESVRDQFMPQGDDLHDEAERIANLRSGPRSNNEVVDDDSPVPNKIEPQSEEPARSDLRHSPKMSVATEPPTRSEAPAVAAPPVPSGASAALEQQDAKAALPERSRVLRESDVVDVCKGAARETAKAWFACIEKLRESGMSEDADRENKAFLLLHPEFLPIK